MSKLFFPPLMPQIDDPIWFKVDKPRDDESELSQLEEKYQEWMKAIAMKDNNIPPIGKSSEHLEEDEEEDEEECEEEEESDTNDDPDTDMMDDRDSNDEASTYG